MRALFRLIVFGFVVMWIDEASATDTVLGKCTQISFTTKRADYPTATDSAALDARSDRLASLEVAWLASRSNFRARRSPTCHRRR